MESERGRRRSNGSSSSSASSSSLLFDGFLDGVGVGSREIGNGVVSSSTSSPPKSPSRSASGSIEHRVSKMDTLAGIAIKYGVEVADIKRMNGLVTDLQMFAHDKLQIPLPGRHPPSPIISNGLCSNGSRGKTQHGRSHIDMLESLESLKLKPDVQRISPAMSSLQGYYGLTTPKKKTTAEGTELAVLKSSRGINFVDEFLPRSSPVSEPPRQKSKNFVNGINSLSKDSADSSPVDITLDDKSVRRRQKTDADSKRLAGKGLALRPKSGSRTDLDTANGGSVSNGFISVRKSSSTSNLQESDGSVLWPAGKWTLKTEAITRPIIDGLPKPSSSRRNKAALD